MQLDGQVAIITGGSKGIGRAIADAYSKEGCAIVVAARTEADVEAAASQIRGSGGRALGVVANVSAELDVDRVVGAALEEFGRVDILVNNAAAIHGPISAVDLEIGTWREVINVNLTGRFCVRVPSCRICTPAAAARSSTYPVSAAARVAGAGLRTGHPKPG